jgi:hypothetical protein
MCRIAARCTVRLCTSMAHFMISTIFKYQNDFNVFSNSPVFHTRLLDIKLTEDDLKKIEISRNISELYMKVFLILVHLWVLTISY